MSGWGAPAIARRIARIRRETAPGAVAGTAVAQRRDVLRITRQEDTPDTLRLVVEGRLVGEWVALLASEIARGEARRARIVVDVTRLDFANRDGVSLIRSAARRGTRLEGVSPLLESLLVGADP